MMTGKTLQAPFFFLPPSPACLALDLRVVVFSLGILSVGSARPISFIDASSACYDGGALKPVSWMMWMMWMKSRSDVTTTTIAKDHNLLRLGQGLGGGCSHMFQEVDLGGGGSSVMDVVDLRWVGKRLITIHMAMTRATIATLVWNREESDDQKMRRDMMTVKWGVT